MNHLENLLNTFTRLKQNLKPRIKAKKKITFFLNNNYIPPLNFLDNLHLIQTITCSHQLVLDCFFFCFVR